MFSLQFPIPAKNIHTPPKLSQIYGSPHRRPFNLRLRASDAAKIKNNGRIVAGEELPAGLKEELMPKHVVMILDGNVRWARRKNLPGSMGHYAGVRALKEIIDLCLRWEIPILTLFAFSYDNWVRSKVEVGFLMVMFERVLKSQLEKCLRKGIRLSVIGDISKFPKSLQTLVNEAVETSKGNTKLQIIVAASYSGRYDIVRACKTIVEKAKDNLVQIENIDENLIEQELETKCTDYPNPDLLIRTSGELRLSNFLLWQLAYTEFYFVDSLWPDFGENEFVKALASYQKRKRRYGGRKSSSHGSDEETES